MPNPSALLEHAEATRQTLRKTARWTALLAGAIGIGAMVGWVADVDGLRTFGADFPSMQLGTALGLVLATAALVAVQSAREGVRRAGRYAAGAAVALGLLSLLSHATGAALGLDFAFTGLARSPDELPKPMAISSAFALTLAALGIAFAPVASASAVAVNRAIVIAVASLAIVSLVGLTFRALMFYGISPLFGMSLPGAVAFVLLAISLLAARPDAWLVGVVASERPGAVITRWMLPAAILVPLVAHWLHLLGMRAGLVDEPVAEGLLTLLMIAVLGALTLWIAGELDRYNARRERAEEEARTQREWLQVVLAGIGDGVMATDRAGRVRFLNAAAQQFARHPDTAVGRPIEELLEIVDERTGLGIGSPLERALAERRPAAVGGEPALRLPGGMLQAVEINAAPILDSRGELAGGVLMVRDAARRRAAERAMREAYAELDRRVIERNAALERTAATLHERTTLLTTIAATTPDLIYAKDLDGRFLMVNPAYLRAIGKADLDVVGRSALELDPDPDRARGSADSDRTVVESGRSITVEEHFAGAAGARTYLTTKSPLRDEQGRVVALIGVATDITDRKRAERELENLVATEQRLRGEAERANRAKDEFLAIVSHELRSPLNALRGWGHLLAATRPLDPGLVDRATAAIKRNVEHQARLIDDILDTSRSMSGKLTLERHPLDLVEVVHAALEITRPAAGAKRIELRAESDHPVVTVDGDPGRLQQVVTNLLSNAIKFTAQGGVIRTEVRLAGQHVQLAVRDNGQGIAPEFLPHVFERFTQADTSTTRRAGGLGIGLALVRNIVELHGGKVRAESEGVGLGAAFIVELPAPAIAMAARSPAPAAGAGAAERRLSGLRVHVVDDDPDAREVIGLALRQAGAAVEAFESGDALLAALERADSPPDVLLLDLAMPGEDGFAVLARVRTLEAARAVEPECELPAIAVSAFTQIDRQRLAAAGFRDRVAKPVDAERLVSAIRAVVDWPWPGKAPLPGAAAPDQAEHDASRAAR